MVEKVTDAELISAYLQEDDESAFSVLVERYISPVYSFARSLSQDDAEAEDVVQDVFLKVWKNIARYDTEKSFKTWIFGITKNTVIDHKRKKKPTNFSFMTSLIKSSKDEDGEFEDTLSDPEPLAHELFHKKELRESLEMAIRQLPEIYRAIVTIKYTEDLTLQEIADIFGESLNTVKSRYRRALEMLKKTMTAHGVKNASAD